MRSISRLNICDLESAFAIEKVSHLIPWSKAIFYSNQGEGYRNYKIEQDNEIIGFCIIKIVADEASLFNIAIKPTCQRQGIAKKLLNYVINVLKIKKIKTLWLEVRASNKKAIYLYQSLGFNIAYTRPHYYPTARRGQFETALIMVRTLMIDTMDN